MKILLKTIAFSAATLTLAVGAMLTMPASAKTLHHSKRTMRHHRRSSTKHMQTISKSSMKGGAMGSPTGMANPAMSTAPATSGGDKP